MLNVNYKAVPAKFSFYQILTTRVRLNYFLVDTETVEIGNPGVRWMGTDPGKVHTAFFTLYTYTEMMQDLF